ncbi:MAG: restriction endonuclease subunit S [Thermomicrobiales bacterium]
MADENDWQYIPLGELTENFDALRVPVKESKRKSGPYPYYGASGIVDWVDSYILDGEYLLVAEDGENLRTQKTSIAFIARGRIWINNHAHVVQANHKADTRFLMYALSQAEVSAYLTGSTMPKLTQNNLNRVPILTPPLCKQRAIAHILGTLDDKIELNRKMNETLDEIARTLFTSWFVNFDPVRAKAEGRQPEGMDAETAALFPDRFVDSEVGEIPDGWDVQKVGEICQIAIGGDWGADEPKQGTVEVICLRGVDLEHLRRSGHANAPRRWVKDSSLARRAVHSSDVLVGGSGAGPTGRPLWMAPHLMNVFDLPVIYSNFCKRLRCASPSVAVYLDRCLFEMRESGEIWTYVNGTSIPNLDTKLLLDTKRLLVPSSPVLDRFSTLIRLMFAKLFSDESRTLAELRDTLLPRLLSGEIQVCEAVELEGAAV